MEKLLKVNYSLINLSHPNPAETSFCRKQQSHQLIRRRLKGLVNTQKRKKSIGQSQLTTIRYIPFRKGNYDNSISISISRQGSKQNLHDKTKNSLGNHHRFRRNTDQFEDHMGVSRIVLKEVCKISQCAEEKATAKQEISCLKMKNHHLERDNFKLTAQLKGCEEKIKRIEQRLQQKSSRFEELSTLLIKRQIACNRMHQSVNEKYRQITKLQDIISKLQKQIMSSNNPQSFTPLSLESSRIINQLSSQLKYKQIENHLLKKDRFDCTVLEEQNKALKKENKILQERLSYYIRINGKDLCQSCSSESLSLNLSESSPLKRSKMQFESLLKIPQLQF